MDKKENLIYLLLFFVPFSAFSAYQGLTISYPGDPKLLRPIRPPQRKGKAPKSEKFQIHLSKILGTLQTAHPNVSSSHFPLPLKLTGILALEGRQKFAFFHHTTTNSHKAYREQDVVEGAKILRITPRFVVLLYGKKQYKLFLPNLSTPISSPSYSSDKVKPTAPPDQAPKKQRKRPPLWLKKLRALRKSNPKRFQEIKQKLRQWRKKLRQLKLTNPQQFKTEVRKFRQWRRKNQF
ncbi:MAG: hypothetical protein D6805_07070 [Planctomycetota bacterium]|nr:MAG: hypothetical protein D6805_07070 [Planctomycetota bacterium]